MVRLEAALLVVKGSALPQQDETWTATPASLPAQAGSQLTLECQTGLHAHTSRTAEGGEGSFKHRTLQVHTSTTGEVKCCDAWMAGWVHGWTEGGWS